MIKIHQTVKITDETWLNLYESYFDRPDGKPGCWVFASRSRNNDGTPTHKADAVIIVPVVRDATEDRLCMIQEFRIPIQDYEWHFPAGLIEPGEDVVSAAKRELKEEAGLELVKVTEISPNLYSSTGMTDESAIMVFCDCLVTGEKQQLDSTEDIQFHLLNHKEVMDVMTDSSKKMSAKTWPVLQTYRMMGHF